MQLLGLNLTLLKLDAICSQIQIRRLFLGIELKLTNVNILKYFNYYQLLIIIEMLWRASK